MTEWSGMDSNNQAPPCCREFQPFLKRLYTCGESWWLLIHLWGKYANKQETLHTGRQPKALPVTDAASKISQALTWNPVSALTVLFYLKSLSVHI